MQISKIISILIISSSFIACKSKMTSKLTSQKMKGHFVVQENSVKFTFNDKSIKCDQTCEVKNLFLVVLNNNNKMVYNKFGELIINSSKSKVSVSKNFAVVEENDKNKVYSGYTGKIIKSVDKNKFKVKVSDSFLIIENGLNILIYNFYGQEIITKTAKIYQKTYISNGFVGYQLDNKEIVFYNQGLHKLISYSYEERQSINIELNNNFLYYKLGNKVSSLYHSDGQRLMRFDGRPSEKIYITENVAGFYDISSSASFWDKSGKHLKSFIRKPGLQVVQNSEKLMYRFDSSNPFKSVN